MESSKQEVNIFKGTVSKAIKVMGPKFAGSSLVPFFGLNLYKPSSIRVE